MSEEVVKETVVELADKIIKLAEDYASDGLAAKWQLEDVVTDLTESVNVRDALYKQAIDLTQASKRKVIDLWEVLELEEYDDDVQGRMSIILAGLKIIALPSNELEAQEKTETLNDIVDLVEYGMDLAPVYSIANLFMMMFNNNMPPKVFVDSIKAVPMADILEAEATRLSKGE